MKKEIWKTIRGYPWYQVSNLGRVKSVARSIPAVSVTGRKYLRFLREKILSPSTGQPQVWLSKASGDTKGFYVSRLVARAFIGKPPKRNSLVLHGDDDPENNNVTNLRWGSSQDNADDMTSRGRSARLLGSANFSSVLTESNVRKIDKMLRSGVRQLDIAERFQVSRSAIYLIKAGVNWRHVTGMIAQQSVPQRLKKQTARLRERILMKGENRG